MSEPLYQLRADALVELPDTKNTYDRFVTISDGLGQYVTDLELEAFNRGFQRVDLEELKTQLAEIFSDFYAIENFDNDDAVDAVLSLFFPVVNQKEETQ